jgi:predicted CoA-binding protein
MKKKMKELFESYNNIAVVGMSRHLEKPSFTVPSYMKKQGYKVIPVNPTIDSIMKLPSYPDLKSVPDFVEIVLVFRPSNDALEIVKHAIERKNEKGDVKVIWLQLGIINDEAKELAIQNGIEFIQDKCIYVEHKNVYS